jgi:hypothetical protein
MCSTYRCMMFFLCKNANALATSEATDMRRAHGISRSSCRKYRFKSPPATNSVTRYVAPSCSQMPMNCAPQTNNAQCSHELLQSGSLQSMLQCGRRNLYEVRMCKECHGPLTLNVLCHVDGQGAFDFMIELFDCNLGPKVLALVDTAKRALQAQQRSR